MVKKQIFHFEQMSLTTEQDQTVLIDFGLQIRQKVTSNLLKDKASLSHNLLY